MPGPYFAFTIDDLVDPQEKKNGLLDVLNDYESKEQEHTSSLSIGWFMNFDLRTDQEGKIEAGTQLPRNVRHLVANISQHESGTSPGEGNNNRTIGPHLKIKFSYADAGEGLNNEGTPSRETRGSIKYQQYAISAEPENSRTGNQSEHINTVKRADTDKLNYEYGSPRTKAIFFSRTQLLLAREFLNAKLPLDTTRTLLFSGCQYAVGSMGERRNMLELERLSENGRYDVEHWFSLKAEVWETSINIEPTDLTFEFDRERLLEQIRRFRWEYPELPGSGNPFFSGDVPSPRSYDRPGERLNQNRVERKAVGIPYLYFGQPCPPGWIPTDEAFGDMVHYVEETARDAGGIITDFRVPLYSYLRDIFTAIGENRLTELTNTSLILEYDDTITGGGTNGGTVNPAGGGG